MTTAPAGAPIGELPAHQPTVVGRSGSCNDPSGRTPTATTGAVAPPTAMATGGRPDAGSTSATLGTMPGVTWVVGAVVVVVASPADRAPVATTGVAAAETAVAGTPWRRGSAESAAVGRGGASTPLAATS